MEPGADETRKPGLGIVSELNLYYLLVASTFSPSGCSSCCSRRWWRSCWTQRQRASGLAQSALSAPMFCLLLFGGLLAERARAGPTIALLYLGFAFMSLILCAVVAAGAAHLFFPHHLRGDRRLLRGIRCRCATRR
jgi:hypothetical protein